MEAFNPLRSQLHGGDQLGIHLVISSRNLLLAHYQRDRRDPVESFTPFDQGRVAPLTYIGQNAPHHFVRPDPLAKERFVAIQHGRRYSPFIPRRPPQNALLGRGYIHNTH